MSWAEDIKAMTNEGGAIVVITIGGFVCGVLLVIIGYIILLVRELL